jgi:hypothetical protein
MKVKKSLNLLMFIVLVLFFVVIVNFIGVNNETFVETDSINSNIIILNRIIESSNNKETSIEKKYQPLTSFNL